MRQSQYNMCNYRMLLLAAAWFGFVVLADGKAANAQTEATAPSEVAPAAAPAEVAPAAAPAEVAPAAAPAEVAPAAAPAELDPAAAAPAEVPSAVTPTEAPAAAVPASEPPAESPVFEVQGEEPHAAQPEPPPPAVEAPGTANKDVLPGKDLSFSWEPIKGAKGYEVEFRKRRGGQFVATAESLKKTTSADFAGRLAVGVYQVRIRSIDRRGVPGVWSDPIDLAIPMPKAVSSKPQSGEVIQGKGQDLSSVTFTWAKSVDASTYRLSVFDSQGKVFKEQDLSQPQATLSLPVAADYSWTVRAIGPDGDEGEGSASVAFRLLGGKLAVPKPEFFENADGRKIVWTAVQLAETYDIELKLEQNGALELVEAKAGYADLNYLPPKDLKPGVYRVLVTAKSNWRQSSEAGKTSFKVAPPKVEQPKPKPVVKAPKKKKKKKKKDPMAELAKLLTAKSWRVAAKYTPTLWNHGAADDDNAGVAFDILLFSRMRLDTELWIPDRSFSFSLTYDRWATSLFSKGVETSGVVDEQPQLNLNSNELALKARYHRPILFSEFSAQAGVRRSSIIFFYKDTPATIALVNTYVTSLTLGAGARLSLGWLGELHGLAEFGYPLGGTGFTLTRAKDYRLTGEYLQYLGSPAYSLSFYYQYDFRNVQYRLSSPETSGHVIDRLHTVGIGLELRL